MILKPQNHEEWLKMRENGIGGSDAGSALGVNSYKSNITLWFEKTGREKAPDISNNSAVIFGKRAEPHLRALFEISHPEYSVDYHEFYMYVNDDYPYIYATLDGELTDENGRHGILEIKTANVRSKSKMDEWQKWDRETKTYTERMPDSYYAQVLHQLAATGWDFVILYGMLRSEKNTQIVERRIERSEVADEIEYLIEKERVFWEYVKSNTMPPLILPNV